MPLTRRYRNVKFSKRHSIAHFSLTRYSKIMFTITLTALLKWLTMYISVYIIHICTVNSSLNVKTVECMYLEYILCRVGKIGSDQLKNRTQVE